MLDKGGRSDDNWISKTHKVAVRSPPPTYQHSLLCTCQMPIINCKNSDNSYYQKD